MQGKRKRPSKKCALLRQYTPENQLSLDLFESPFGQDLDQKNRWIQLSSKIPWDEIVSLYHSHYPPKSTGRPGVNPRILIGSTIIKHLNDYDDRETVEQIRENVYLQYFLGYRHFSKESPFDSSVFVSIRKKLTPDLLHKINTRIYAKSKERLLPKRLSDQEEDRETSNEKDSNDSSSTTIPEPTKSNKGQLLMDASVSPQAIAYPTDLNLLNDARQMSEKIIDELYCLIKEDLQDALFELTLSDEHTVFTSGRSYQTDIERLENRIKVLKDIKKPRTYREVARKEYLKVAQNKKPSKKKIRLANGKQLRFLRRNLRHIENLLNEIDTLSFPLDHSLQRYYWIIQLLYEQQLEMFTEKKKSVTDRLVSIHQPHVRPMVRGKAKASTEFGAKIHLSLVDGFSFLDTISWDAFNESTHLKEYVKHYKDRFGYYPEKVLVDKIYCTRENRKWLKERNIKLAAKPLGRPSSAQAMANHVSPGERNPIEGKFGQAKTAYGLNRIRAKLQHTSESWIASIILVLNLVHLTRVAAYCLMFLSFSEDARLFLRKMKRKIGYYYPYQLNFH